MDQQAATADLDYIRDVVRKTHARIDTHAFHTVWWGALVLVWYPLSNWLQNRELFTWMAGVIAGAMVLGFLGSFLLEFRLRFKPRLKGENTFIARQAILIVYANIAGACVLSALGPDTGFIAGPNVPIIWGLAYANIAFMLGVVYTREYLVAGLAIFLGAALAILFQRYAGYILGPFMGLGMIIPGVMGERRVRRLMREDEQEQL